MSNYSIDPLEHVTKENQSLICKTLLFNGCPTDQVNNHLDNVTRQLVLDYQTKRLTFTSFFEYLCNFEADCLIDTYIETEFS